MEKQHTDAVPILEELAQQRRAVDYMGRLRILNAEANDQELMEAAVRVGDLLTPLEAALKDRNIPYFQVATMINDLRVEVVKTAQETEEK